MLDALQACFGAQARKLVGRVKDAIPGAIDWVLRYLYGAAAVQLLLVAWGDENFLGLVGLYTLPFTAILVVVAFFILRRLRYELIDRRPDTILSLERLSVGISAWFRYLVLFLFLLVLTNYVATSSLVSSLASLSFLLFVEALVYLMAMENTVLGIPLERRTASYLDYLATKVEVPSAADEAGRASDNEEAESFGLCLHLLSDKMIDESNMELRDADHFVNSYRLMLYSKSTEGRKLLALRVRGILTSIDSPDFPTAFIRAIKRMTGDTDLSPNGLADVVRSVPGLEEYAGENIGKHPLLWQILVLVMATILKYVIFGGIL